MSKQLINFNFSVRSQKIRRIMSFKEFMGLNNSDRHIGRQRGSKPDVSQGTIPKPKPEI